jgi:hypothetical protein
VLRALGLEVGEVDVAVGVALRDDDLHADHLRARRVGAVRRLGDQADGAAGLAARGVPGADREQPAYSPCEPALGCRLTPA